jgi:hypothetical protein
MVSGQWSVVRCPSSMVHGPLALVTMIVLTLAAQTVFAAGEGNQGTSSDSRMNVSGLPEGWSPWWPIPVCGG